MIKKFVTTAVFSGAMLVSGMAFAAERTVTLGVEGMSCVSCPYIVKEVLSSVDGVKAVGVSMLERTAIVTFEDTRSGVADLTAAVSDYGYPAHLISEGS